MTAASGDPGRRRASVAHFVAGAFFAMLFSFLVTLGAGLLVSATTDPANYPQLFTPPLWVIALVWTITIGVVALLYRWHPWAAFGMIGGYAALLATFLFVGGIFGPSTCFNAYGYPYGVAPETPRPVPTQPPSGPP